jgi:hypothetical protein
MKHKRSTAATGRRYFCSTSGLSMTRTEKNDSSDDFVYCNSDGDEVQGSMSDDDTSREPGEEENVWKEDDVLLSSGIDSIDCCEQNEGNGSTAETELAALRSEIRVLQETIGTQRLANDILRRRVAKQETKRHSEPDDDGSPDHQAKVPPNNSHDSNHQLQARMILVGQAHMMFVCLACHSYVLLNGSNDFCVFFLIVFIGSRGLLLWMDRKGPLLDNPLIILWLSLCIFPYNTPLMAVASILLALAEDYVGDMKHYASTLRPDNSYASFDSFFKGILDCSQYTFLFLLALTAFAAEEPVRDLLLSPVFCFQMTAFLLLIILLQPDHYDCLRVVIQFLLSWIGMALTIFNAITGGGEISSTSGLIAAIIVSVMEYYKASAKRRAAAEAKKRD